jgi:L-ribulose-5-phosphate 4-epimerase
VNEKERLRRLRETVYRANLELEKRGLVVYTFGNASGIDRQSGIVAIKPSGVEYEKLCPENMVLVDLNGNRVEGDYNPSSDTKTHVKLYQAFEDIGGIVHTHSTFATSWAQALKPIPCFGTTHADYFYGEVPCTEIITDDMIRRDYEEETGNLIINTFRKRDYHSMPAVLVACHGPFVWGKDPEEAVYLSVMLEEVARTGMLSLLLNPELRGIKQTLLDKHYLRKHGADAYYGQKKV